MTSTNLDCEEPAKVINKLKTNFGRVSSESEEILFGEDGPEILIVVGSGTYKVDVQLNKRFQTILAVDGQQISLSFRGMKTTCFKCFGVGYIAK